MADQPHPAASEKDAPDIIAKDEGAAFKHLALMFCNGWGAQQARDPAFVVVGLHPSYYDLLERSGARMNGFYRAEAFFPEAFAEDDLDD